MAEDRSSISGARSYREIGEFWDEHDLGEFWEQTSPAEFDVTFACQHVLLRRLVSTSPAATRGSRRGACHLWAHTEDC